MTCTHIDDGILELDVEPVVRNGNNGFVSVAKVLNPFPLKNWERHLRTQNSWIIAVDQCQTIKTRCKQTRTVGLLLLQIVEPEYLFCPQKEFILKYALTHGDNVEI